MGKYLVLYSPAHRTGQELRWRLAEDADVTDVRRRLDKAQPGEFVTVPVVLEDELDTLLLRVQPHQFGAWLVLDLAETQRPTAPLPAARARVPDFGQIFRDAAEAVRESTRQQRK
ncbi:MULTISPECIES: hypothetical protein [Mycobacterium]|uniref:Uncharacterized protein n=1 Tax=Mycobacterium gordonae TaxID=1778 RepID=A0A0Q2RWU2_MYCGO|nr:MULTISPECIES: hypothetical protein [Mycobacterium]KQH79635.1 hypothetical protein AO501_20835 [Mycobacterium gordonae]MDP7729405.1 hypothetical protein [Mycobacterium sp. TY813]